MYKLKCNINCVSTTLTILVGFVLIGGFACVLIPIGLANGMSADDVIKYHGSMHETSCLGGNNITNIWYSPQYPFNETYSYSPARMTFDSFVVNHKTNQTYPVTIDVPDKYQIITNSQPCNNCASGSSCNCAYSLGDLIQLISKLKSVDSYPCVTVSGKVFSIHNVPINDINISYTLLVSAVCLFSITILIAISLYIINRII